MPKPLQESSVVDCAWLGILYFLVWCIELPSFLTFQNVECIFFNYHFLLVLSLILLILSPTFTPTLPFSQDLDSGTNTHDILLFSPFPLALSFRTPLPFNFSELFSTPSFNLFHAGFHPSLITSPSIQMLSTSNFISAPTSSIVFIAFSIKELSSLVFSLLHAALIQLFSE